MDLESIFWELKEALIEFFLVLNISLFKSQVYKNEHRQDDKTFKKDQQRS